MLSMAVELGLEVDSTGGVSVVEECDELLSGAVLGEEVEGDLGLGDVVALVDVRVEDVDFHVMVNETSVDLHVLSVPLGVLATVLANGGGPFLVTDFDVNNGVHLMEETTLVVFEVSLNEVQVDVTMTSVGKDYNDWH